MKTRKLAKLDALKNRLIFSAHVGRKKRGIKDTTVDGMKIKQRRFEESLSLHHLDPFLLYCFLVNPAALQFVSILDDQGRIHKEAREAQSDHE
jgi:hypothetical protein